MSAPNIVLTRVDDRFIHGQVVSQWKAQVDANLIIVANDALSKDRMRQKLMDMSAPTMVATRYFSIAKTVKVLKDVPDSQRIFIIVESIADALALVERGVPIKILNVGNTKRSPDKRRVSSAIYLDETDQDALHKMQDSGVELLVQRVPTEPAMDSELLFAA